jgi:N-acetylmuramoyl-L-alanine amidase
MSMMISNNVFTGNDIIRMECSKNKTPFSPPFPDTIVIHFTAGSSALSSAQYLCTQGLQASAHLVVGRDATVYQLVPFNIISWHAGVSRYAGRNGLNQYAIGIELDNEGPLVKQGSKYYSEATKKFYPESDVILARHRNETTPRYWHKYPDIQVLKCKEICRVLITKYGIRTIVGHEEIAPNRKSDPGPAFPLDQFRLELLPAVNTGQPGILRTGTVTASSLNIRIGPGTTFAKAGPALPMGTLVTILDEMSGWYKVLTDIEGWVRQDYIKLN